MKRRSGKVIHFPKPYDEEAELAKWILKFEAEMVPRAEEIRGYLTSGYASIGTAMSCQREMFEGMDLFCQGLSPREKDEMISRQAPRWAELAALQERNRAKAKELVRRRQETQ